jgi:CHAD domain-containing protein
MPVLAEHARDTDLALSEIESQSDKSQMHKARLLVKSLRYLLESVSDDLPQSGSLLNVLRRLQDLIGGLRDAQMLSEELDKIIRRAKNDEKLQAIKDASERNKREIEYLFFELRNKLKSSSGLHFLDKVQLIYSA